MPGNNYSDDSPFAHGNTLVRAKIKKIDDTGEQQLLQATARHQEQYGGKQLVLRVQAHGFSGNPPEGSLGIMLMMNGSPDMAYGLDFEHPDHRPKNLATGGAKQYDDQGNYHEMSSEKHEINAVQDHTVNVARNMIMKIEGDLTITVTGTVIIDCPDIHLGGAGGTPILLAGGTEMGHSATKVKAQ
jgi:phage gp45-like